MTLPPVRINTFVKTAPKPTKPFVDVLSKIYIIGGLLVGINRVGVLTHSFIFTIPSFMYSLFVVCATFYASFTLKYEYCSSVFIVLNSIMYLCCLTFGFMFNKRMRRYYNEISKFDMEVGCRPKTERLSIIFYTQMCLVIACVFGLFALPYGTLALTKYVLHIPINGVYVAELHYYGHILSLLTPRLRLINYYMQMSMCNAKSVKTKISNRYVFFKNYNENSNCKMKKIIDVYYIIYQSYNYLVEAIKWQLLLIIFTSFASVLGCCYHFSLNIISGERSLDNLISDMGLSLMSMVPLFAPCISGDQVHSEVRRLRELLASRLYENKLDKSARSIARALLDFTENRDLSFRLLRILDVDISLPFKFVGLLVTYLIILLQFEKVINP